MFVLRYEFDDDKPSGKTQSLHPAEGSLTYALCRSYPKKIGSSSVFLCDTPP